MTRYTRALHIFRRDLRLSDNSALNAAFQSAKEVVPCFIFNDKQITPHPYRSANGLAFMLESIQELSEEVSKHSGVMLTLRGEPSEVIAQLIKSLAIDAVFFNKDYTPFSRVRDEAIANTCRALGVECHILSDALLVEPANFGKDDGKPYTVFTPFFKRAAKNSVAPPKDILFDETKSHFLKQLKLDEQIKRYLASPLDFWPKDVAPGRRSLGGRARGKEILKGIDSFSRYDQERDFPALGGTTLLGPHNKFGTISIREVYSSITQAFGVEHTLVRELYWRDFFTHIAWHFPHVFGHAFNRQYDAIEWNEDQMMFQAWCEGRTGFPIVDAGMRELVTTGFMHNRVRMIVASFLVKDMHIDWRKGERFFAQHLTDYDPAVNNGSWQWAASTGCDAQPYFRIFNPWLQQKRFDPECLYVKHWIPELKQLQSSYIHKWYEDDFTRSVDYPSPIFEHATRKVYAEEMFRKCLGR